MDGEGLGGDRIGKVVVVVVVLYLATGDPVVYATGVSCVRRVNQEVRCKVTQAAASVNYS